MKRWIPGLAAAAAFVILMVWSAGPATAHVLLDSAQPEADGSVTLTFSFDHACDESPTNRLELSVPAGSTIEAVDQPSGWSGELSGSPAATVVWTGPGIEPGTPAHFVVQARLTGAVGSALIFPAIQSCVNDESYEWTEVGETGERPAPRLIATSAVLDQRLVPSDIRAEQTGTPAIGVALALFVAGAGIAAWVLQRRLTD